MRFGIIGAIDFSHEVDMYPLVRINSRREALRPRIGADVQLKEAVIFDDESQVRDAIATAVERPCGAAILPGSPLDLHARPVIVECGAVAGERPDTSNEN